jgi:hypothetical protein
MMMTIGQAEHQIETKAYSNLLPLLTSNFRRNVSTPYVFLQIEARKLEI